MDKKAQVAIEFRVLQVAQKWHLSETEHADLLQDAKGHALLAKCKSAAGVRMVTENFLRNWQKRYFRTRRIFRPLTRSIAEGVITRPNTRNASEAILRAFPRVLGQLSAKSRKIAEIFLGMEDATWGAVADEMGMKLQTFRERELVVLKNEFRAIWERVQHEVQ
jgi:hypothetical protein